MAGKTVDERDKGRMELALALGKALQKHDFRKTQPMVEDTSGIVRAAVDQGLVSKDDAGMILMKAENLCVSDTLERKSISRSVTLGRGDETDVYGRIFRYDGTFEMINGATGKTEHRSIPKTDKEHVFKDNESNREIRIFFRNVFHSSVDVDITVSQIEPSAAPARTTKCGYASMGEQELIKMVKQGLASKLADGIPLTEQEKKLLRRKLPQQGDVVLKAVDGVPRRQDGKDLLDGKDPPYDATVCMAAAPDKWKGMHPAGDAIDVGGYSVTVKSIGQKSAIVDIKGPDGRMISAGEELDMGIDTTITIPADGKEIAIFLHGVRAHAADVSIEVFGINGPCPAQAAAPSQFTQTVTINRGSETIIEGYRFYYRSDTGHSSRMAVIRDSTGIPLDDFTPKADRKVVLEDSKESKRITIVPKVVYVASVTLEIAIEDIQKTGSGSGGSGSGGTGPGGKKRDWGSMSDDELVGHAKDVIGRKGIKKKRDWGSMSDDDLVDHAKDVIGRNGIRNRRDLAKGDAGMYEILKRRQLLDQALPKVAPDKADDLLKLGMQVVDKLGIKTSEELEQTIGKAIRGDRK